MNNFFELEKKCKKYHQKRIMLLLVFILIAVLVIFSYLFFNQKEEVKVIDNKHIIDKNISKKVKVVEKKVFKRIEVKKIEPKKKIEIINKDEAIPTLEPKINIDMINFDENRESNHKKIVNKEVNKTTQIKVESNETLKKVKTINIKKSNKLIITEEIPSFKKSFKLMNLYFKDEDYEKSKEWALKASKIKPKNEDIWKIYALSLYKLNQKEKAIKVLKTYLKYKKSTKIEQTLKLIEEGK